MQKKLIVLSLVLVLLALIVGSAYAQEPSDGRTILQEVLNLNRAWNVERTSDHIHYQIVLSQTGYTLRTRTLPGTGATHALNSIYTTIAPEIPGVQYDSERHNYVFMAFVYQYQEGEAPIAPEELAQMGVAAGLPRLATTGPITHIDQNPWFPGLEGPAYKKLGIGYFEVPQGVPVQDQVEKVPFEEIATDIESFSEGLAMPPLEAPVLVTAEPNKGFDLVPAAGIQITGFPLGLAAGVGILCLTAAAFVVLMRLRRG